MSSLDSIKIQLAVKLSIKTICEDLFSDVFYVYFKNPIETDCLMNQMWQWLKKMLLLNAKLLRDVCKGLFLESFARVMPQTENLVADIEFFGLEEVVRYR